MKNFKTLFFYIIFFQLVAINVDCQRFVPMARKLHTAALVETKLHFLGGATIDKALNDFFYLDISKSFDKASGGLPFVDASNKAIEIPPHVGAVTSVFGELKDSIFFFGGSMEQLNTPSRLMHSFNSAESKWKSVTVSPQSIVPERRMLTSAVTDNNNKIYIFGGGFNVANVTGQTQYIFYNEMNIFDTINKIWTNGDIGFARDGHTATFLRTP